MNKSFDTLAPQQQATQLALDITNAKALGKDVKAAEQHQVLGEKALKSGETASASKHFKEAEEALGMNSSSTSPSSMAPSMSGTSKSDITAPSSTSPSSMGAPTSGSVKPDLGAPSASSKTEGSTAPSSTTP